MEKMYPFLEVSELWGCSLAMIKKLHLQRAIEVVKVGNKNFIKESELKRFIDSNTIPIS